MVTNINGHSVGVSQFAGLGFVDMERIEVLKGPQGTINGLNSVQGVINLITARPTSDLEGYVKVEMGNYNRQNIQTAINLPFSDTVKGRVALMSNTRDGMVNNPVTGNDFDDRNDIGVRLSLDFDISEKTDLEFTYQYQQNDDNRPQEEVSFCKPDQFFGCSPYERGELNQAADTRGHVAGFVGFIAHLDPGTITNKYPGASLSDKFDTLYLDREPTHFEETQYTNLTLKHDLTDSVQMTVKYTYQDREFHQMNDNDGSYSTTPLIGVAGVWSQGLGLPPIEATAVSYTHLTLPTT